MRLIIIAILLYILYRVVKNYLFKGVPRGPQGSGDQISDMVQDPVCKTFIRARDAHRRLIGGKTYYFCSSECAERFKIEQRSTE